MRKASKKLCDKATKRLSQLVTEYVLAHGGRETGEEYGYPLILPTAFGDLRVRVSMELHGLRMLTIFCRFDDPDRAIEAGLVNLNTFSGKWNHHISGGDDLLEHPEQAFDHWKRAVDRILLGNGVSVES